MPARIASFLRGLDGESGGSAVVSTRMVGSLPPRRASRDVMRACSESGPVRRLDGMVFSRACREGMSASTWARSCAVRSATVWLAKALARLEA